MTHEGFDKGAMLDDRIAIVGRAGYGKTNAAKVGVESLLKKRRRVCILDPTDAWYGLRVGKNGRDAAFPVVIFGGQKADLPINEHAGATLGEAVAKSHESCIVSIADFIGEGARRRFASDFLGALYHHNKAPLHLIVDEADLFAPQKPMTPGDNILLARMSQIVRRGRLKGFFPWLITQRPAVLNKDVLSQADVLCAFNLTSSQDRRAIGAWIEGQADKAEEKSLLAMLPKLPRGEAMLWAPGRGILERRSFPLSETFDSGRTMAHGETRHAARLRPLDVGKLRDALAVVVAEQESNDPSKLKKQIADLKRELDRAKNAATAAAPDRSALAAKFSEGHDIGVAEGYAMASDAHRPLILAMRAELAAWVDRFEKDIAKIAPPARKAQSIAPPIARAPANAATNGAGPATLPKAHAAILTVLCQLGGTADGPRVAAITGYSVNGGSFRTYLSALRTAGYVAPGPSPYSITDAGRAALGHYDELPVGPAALAMWIGRLGKGAGTILRALADRGGEATSADLGDATGYAAAGGSFRTYLSKLRTLGLVTGSATLTLHGDLR